MKNNYSSNNNHKTNGLSSIMNGGSDGGRVESGSKEWEMRPGGMLVQMRTSDSDRNSALVPTIRVRVKYGSIYHEVNISSQATFGNSSLFSVLMLLFSLYVLSLSVAVTFFLYDKTCYMLHVYCAFVISDFDF